MTKPLCVNEADKREAKRMKRNGYGSYGEEDEDEVFPLPGFRFHPTDEELVGFYLQRKVEKKPIKIELIKHIDIYQFDPWDLPKPSDMENESYFFCKRGRKYRNSIRPNRVTGSGFWKATGIDKPVHSDKSQGCESVIGLKKTLVYYRGSAGKGTKTDWMMHEFRLPTIQTINHNPKPSSQEAEVWTLCRIFKRNVSSRKYTPDWRELASNKRVKSQPSDTTSTNTYQESYISFCDEEPNRNPIDQLNDQKKLAINPMVNGEEGRNMMNVNQVSSMASQPMSVPAAVINPSYSKIPEDNNDGEMFSYGYWDELRSVVEFALDHSPVY